MQSKRIPLSPIACSLQVYKSLWEDWLWSNPSYWLSIAKVFLISPDLVMPTKNTWSFGAMISFCVTSFKPYQYCCQGLYPSGQKESLSQCCYRWRIIPLTLSNEVTGIALIFWLRYISFYIPLILAECTSFPFCIQDCSWKLIARFSLAWKTCTYNPFNHIFGPYNFPCLEFFHSGETKGSFWQLLFPHNYKASSTTSLSLICNGDKFKWAHCINIFRPDLHIFPFLWWYEVKFALPQSNRSLLFLHSFINR